ncbi:hypothetical protein JOF28_000838 [Leucobacter exalbidus]|uniref:Uncharacterized protein n=1 Tax=Leucobacter exalbidus TaxID=662960 RepID=A0A940T542_9MICO|nr:hypothetical protein [Leucobacter exalbidus]MBP1325606.1 hypothetical protein [Leucobacter exalbidus]
MFFLLSWVYPRRLLTIPGRNPRTTTLTALGIIGAGFVVAVASYTSWQSYLYAFPDPSGFGGWWRRAAPLAAVAVVLLLALLLLRREPRSRTGGHAIAPHHRWDAFARPAQLWTAVALAVLLLGTNIWQSLLGVSAPEGANFYGNTTAHPTQLPIYLPFQGGTGYLAGVGWPNHLGSILALVITTLLLIVALNDSANRPLPVQLPAAEARAQRTATSAMLLWITLGGLLLTLGAVWAHAGFIGEFTGVVTQYDPEQVAPGSQQPFTAGTGYHDIAFIMHKGGYVIQGLGAALLLRVMTDTLRARRFSAGGSPAQSAAKTSEVFSEHQ